MRSIGTSDQSSAPEASALRVSRISDSDPQILRYFAELGLVPGAVVRVVEHRPFAGVSTLAIEGRETPVELGSVALAAVWVERSPAS